LILFRKLWESRNAQVFNNKNFTPTQIVQKAVLCVKDFGRLQRSSIWRDWKKSDAALGSSNWKPSAEDYVVKVNVDAGFLGGWGTTFGYVARDDRGKLMVIGVRQVEGCSSMKFVGNDGNAHRNDKWLLVS